MFLWNLIGKEIITIGQSRLTIDKKGALLFKAKTYDLTEVKNIRVKDDNWGFNSPFAGSRSGGGWLEASMRAETIRFDYGLRTSKEFGAATLTRLKQSLYLKN